ncbi:MAG TPA: ATP-binding protein [Thermoanaerobaculia bacterium]|nr:ATP-binding protein [Thermoanaerobaculia bacterium]
MLSLRGKLVLGFGGLLALLTLVGVQSTIWISRLGGSVDVILRENYDSVVACQDMKEALERMDSGALFALAGDPRRGQQLAAANAPLFVRAMDVELRNITLPGEGPAAFRIRDLYAGYPPLLAQVLDAGRPLPDRRAVYFGRLLPLFQQIKLAADQVQQMNQGAMVRANARARGLAALASRRMLALLALGAALAVGFVLFLSRAILLPLSRLTQSVREVEHGNLDLVVPVVSKDELGELAAAFNAMAGRLRELRRSNRARLLRAQQTSQLAIDSLPDAVAVFSPDLQVELANRTAVSTLGLRPGEPVPPRHADWLPHLLQETARSGTLPDRGYEAARQIFHEGQERFYLPHAVAVRGGDGQLVGITLILSDVTNLRRIDEMKSGLLSTVSHELRTPLTSLQMALHVLLDDRLGALSPQQTELLVAARDDAERLRTILVNLLEIARYEAGGQQLHFEPVPSRDLVEMSLAPLRSAFDDHGINLSVVIAPQAPKVLADPARAPLALGNLLQNALQHTPAGGTVAVQVEPEGSVVRFSVADSGPGIPEEYLGRIFERFFQVPGSQGGAGLGLAIAKEIVQAHGGTVGVESGPAGRGSGATFRFTLPAAPAAA